MSSAEMPPPRVAVFIDGQNLFKGLKRRFGVRLHPLLLARELAGPNRELVGTHRLDAWVWGRAKCNRRVSSRCQTQQ